MVGQAKDVGGLASVAIGAGGYRVLQATSLAELEPHVAAWQRLAEVAAEPNPFYEPWMLLPAISQYGGDNTRVVFVYDEAGELAAVFPLQALPEHRWLALTRLHCFEHPHSYLGTPLLARRQEESCWSAFFSWMGHASAGGSVVSFRNLGADGPVYAALQRVAQREKHFGDVIELAARPLAKVDVAGEEYLATRVGSGHRQSFRRKSRRLAEKGRLESVVLEPDDNLDAWLEEFFTLEASGWKGADGTALACSVRDREFFTQISRAAFARGRLLLMMLRLDGKPLATLYTIVAGAGAFALKTGYDEQWKQYSPGRLLEIDFITVAHERSGCEWIDSCAAPQSTLKELWTQQRMVADVLYGVGMLGGRAPSLLAAARAIKRRIPGLGAAPQPDVAPA